jgi:hypothetical protein
MRILLSLLLVLSTIAPARALDLPLPAVRVGVPAGDGVLARIATDVAVELGAALSRDVATVPIEEADLAIVEAGKIGDMIAGGTVLRSPVVLVTLQNPPDTPAEAQPQGYGVALGEAEPAWLAAHPTGFESTALVAEPDAVAALNGIETGRIRGAVLDLAHTLAAARRTTSRFAYREIDPGRRLVLGHAARTPHMARTEDALRTIRGEGVLEAILAQRLGPIPMGPRLMLAPESIPYR